MASCFSTIPEAIVDLKAGKFLIVCDDEDRENEGDLIMPCQLATAEALAFMVNHTSGVICVGLEDSRCKALQLPPMVQNNEDPKSTAFTVTVDYKHGTTTGISAADRASSLVLVTFSRCELSLVECCKEVVTPRRPWIYPDWQVADPLDSYLK
jgi:3,4-dihydroxy 2-butanone 4-phosphate synthase/GTP cyclohydrolase II